MAGPTDLTLSGIAKQVGLSLSTVHRLLGALCAAGYVEHSADTGRYGFGRSSILLGQVAQHNAGLDLARQVLEQASADTGESVNLGVRDGEHAVVLLRIESPQALRFDQPPGTRVHLHASSMGKALLTFAADPAAEFEALLPLAAITAETITDPDTLLGELEQIRARGYSVDDQESMLGVRCVGAPVFDASGVARAAVAIQVPAVRMPPRRSEELGRLVMRAARDVQGVLSPNWRL